MLVYPQHVGAGLKRNALAAVPAVLLLAAALASTATAANPSTVVKATSSPFVSVGVGDAHACAIKLSGSLTCWGRGAVGQTNIPDSMTYPVRAVSAGANHTCAVVAPDNPNTPRGREQVKVVCWGDASQGKLAVPADLAAGSAYTSKPVEAAKGTVLSAGFNHTCAIRPTTPLDGSGLVRCWGSNENHQSTEISDLVATALDAGGTPLNRLGLSSSGVTPVRKAIDIAAGANHSCAVLTDHAVRCWGSNASGQRIVPQAAQNNATRVVSGFDFSCALLTDQSVTCWGGAGMSRSLVGAGSIAPPPGLRATAISAGVYDVCAVSADTAQPVCWGGPDTTLPDYSRAFPDGTGGQPLVSISAGKSLPWTHVCGVGANERVICWGIDAFGDISSLNPSDFPSQLTVTSTPAAGSTLDLGSAEAAARGSSRTVTITNASAPWVPSYRPVSIATDGAGIAFKPFKVKSDSCSASWLPSGASCSVEVMFTPRAWQRGPVKGTLTITDPATDFPRSYSLTGLAAAPSSFTIVRQGAEVTPAAVNLAFDTSDVTSTITVTARLQGSAAAPTLLTTLKKQPMAALKFVWNRRLGKAAAPAGTYDIVITGTARSGTASITIPVTL